MRLDAYLSERLGKSRSHVQKLIADGLVTVDGAKFMANFKVEAEQ